MSTNRSDGDADLRARHDVGSDQAAVENLLRDLDELADEVSSSAGLESIRETREMLREAGARGLIDSGVRRLEVSDAVEAFIGSVIFASPLLVEDGVFDIADHLFGVTVGGVPVFLLANTLFVVFMTYALLEWTGRDKVETHRLFGVVPARVVMILGVSFVVVTILMTVWGRVDGGQAPSEALARVNVLWTVGSIGAALGDILSHEPSDGAVDSHPPERVGETATRSEATRDGEQLSDGELLTSLHEQFDEFEASVENSRRLEEIDELRQRTHQAAAGDRFGEQIDTYTRRDIAEAFVGSIFFSIPFLVEDGVFDVAEYFLSFQVELFPVFFVLNAVFVLLMVAVLVYWTGPQDVRVTRPIFGVVPRRLVGIAVVSFVTAGALMTMWGRVDGWQDPVIAVARISVVWTVASFGAALGDILPGESSGDDINDDLAEIAELIGVGDETAEE